MALLFEDPKIQGLMGYIKGKTHVCQNGTVRPYPKMVCSLCPPGDPETEGQLREYYRLSEETKDAE